MEKREFVERMVIVFIATIIGTVIGKLIGRWLDAREREGDA